MATTLLVIGGSRSGKSDYAQQRAESEEAAKVFIATCPATIDAEMDNRIVTHQMQRQGRGWLTVEEEIGIIQAVKLQQPGATILIDCLTLWISNLIYHYELKNKKISEKDISGMCHQLISACDSHAGTIIMVTGEVGQGIVPDNPAARLYRDLIGRCNQIVAAAADEVVLVSCGLPLHLKPKPKDL